MALAATGNPARGLELPDKRDRLKAELEKQGQIYFLPMCRVVEDGSHGELLACEGFTTHCGLRRRARFLPELQKVFPGPT